MHYSYAFISVLEMVTSSLAQNILQLPVVLGFNYGLVGQFSYDLCMISE